MYQNGFFLYHLIVTGTHLVAWHLNQMPGMKCPSIENLLYISKRFISTCQKHKKTKKTNTLAFSTSEAKNCNQNQTIVHIVK